MPAWIGFENRRAGAETEDAAGRIMASGGIWKNDWLGTAPGCPGIMPAEMLTGDREEIQRL